jgi:hypothetical protein
MTGSQSQKQAWLREQGRFLEPQLQWSPDTDFRLEITQPARGSRELGSFVTTKDTDRDFGTFSISAICSSAAAACLVFTCQHHTSHFHPPPSLQHGLLRARNHPPSPPPTTAFSPQNHISVQLQVSPTSSLSPSCTGNATPFPHAPRPIFALFVRPMDWPPRRCYHGNATGVFQLIPLHRSA